MYSLSYMYYAMMHSSRRLIYVSFIPPHIMSNFKTILYHPSGCGYSRLIYMGWSWPCFFSGSFWFMRKNMWKWTFLSLIAAVCSGGLSLVVFPLFANSLFEKRLYNKGYDENENMNNMRYNFK